MKRHAELVYIIENDQIDLLEPTASRYATSLGTLTNYIIKNKITDDRGILINMLDEHAKIIQNLQTKFEYDSGWWLALQHDINYAGIYKEKLLLK